MAATPEAPAALFRQLAFISAPVGGFAFTFVGVLLALPSRSRVAGWTAGMARATGAVPGVMIERLEDYDGSRFIIDLND